MVELSYAPLFGLGLLLSQLRHCLLSLASTTAATKGFVELNWISVNDPSAGSPTETLLRLLLPLSDKVYITSRARFKPQLSPEGSPDHSIGRSDGRCVQRAGTYSAQADDLCLQGIPRSRSIITKIYPQHDTS